MVELVRVLPSGEVSHSAAFALSPSVRVWAADAQTAYVTTYASILSTKPGLVFTTGKYEEAERRSNLFSFFYSFFSLSFRAFLRLCVFAPLR